jgi:membrane associated rhomboid family serine protease
MFLPIGDAPNPEGTPLVTYALIAINVAVFLMFNVPLGTRPADVNDPAFGEYVEVMTHELSGRADASQIVAQTSAFDLFSFEHGYRPAAPQVTDLVSCMFLHGGFMHLFGNMLFLWIYGDNVERRLGALPYLFWYLATGVAATLTHALVFSDSSVPLVGASGAISGVLGFYFVFFPRNTVRMLAFLPPFLMQVFQIPARFVLGMYLLIDNLVPFLFAGEGGVAHGAHISGFIVGGVVAWLLERRAMGTRPDDIEAPQTAPLGSGAVRAALAEGRYDDAARAYFALPATSVRGALSASEAVELASWLRGEGHSSTALGLLRQVVRDVRRGDGLAEAHALAGVILLDDLHEPTAAYQYLLTALEMGPRPETAGAVRRSLAVIEDLQKRRVGRLRSTPGA